MSYEDSNWFVNIDAMDLAMDFIESHPSEFIDIDELIQDKPPKIFPPKKDYWQTPWGQMLQDPLIHDPNSKIAKLFKRRFRMPFPMFMNWFVPEAQKVNLFDIKYENKVQVPLEFKLLICLRILARGNCCDDVAELSGSFDSSCNYFFHAFVPSFVKHFYTQFVFVPTGERLAKTMRVYEQLGSAGACGSMDATHLKLGKCPEFLRNLAEGKETYPSVAINLVCDHFRFVHHVSEPFLGAFF